MKKLLVLVSCFVVLVVLSKVSFAQSDESAAPTPTPLSVEAIVADAPAPPQVLPFGYPPYPTVGGHPAYGIPYSYPRTQQRRFLSRLAPPPYQPCPLPAPGSMPGPQLQETLGAIPPAQAEPQKPTVYYRPTPVKNFMALITAPRPYIGYNPYAGYPPFPGYIPPQ
jgi:hypothetical protein